MIRSCFLLLAAVLLVSPVLAAQEPAPAANGWNTARALELIGRAQERRRETRADTGLVNYRADARIYVYFYLDRQDTGERNLVKTDQLALDVLWAEPNRVKQRIVGWRDQKSLPTNIHYHMDHLTVVQENFGDLIHLGDGDEVQGVLHPGAPGAESFYEYRLADSLTLRLPGAAEPVRVYELQVRPRDLGEPGFLGSVFVDRRAGDLVRLDFTFTPSAYRDPYLDHISISLENGLWKGRFWLPSRQQVEVRREIPQLDIPAGSVIRATMRVGNYRFNEPLPPGTFAGPRVSALPPEQREAFPFEQGLHEEVREEGIGPQAELDEVREMAAGLAREQVLSGASGVRLRIPRASELLRYNRAEGAVVGLGLSWVPRPSVRAEAQSGWAFGADHPLGVLAVEGDWGEVRVEGSLYGNQPRDVGVGPIVSGTVNSLSAVLAAEDYTDLYYASGARLGIERPLSAEWMLMAGLRAESQRSAEQEAEFAVFGDGPDFRAVRPVDEGTMLGGTLGLRRSAPSGVDRWWTADLRSELGILRDTDDGLREDHTFVRPVVGVGWGRRWETQDAMLEIGGRAGITFGELPRQALYLIGGRGTLPGYDFRAFGGDRFAIADVTASAEIWRPWLRARGLAAAGWSGVGDVGERSLDLWGAETTGGLKTSVGVGLGIFHDILRVDLARGLGEGGRWELIIGASPTFWDFL